MYLDTSIIVKLFVREVDSEFYGKLTDGNPVCSSILAYTEVWSAILAKERSGGLTPAWRRRAWSAFDKCVMNEAIELIPMDAPIFKRANRILEKCHPKIPLRSLDALHLASADHSQDWPLVTNDSRMRDAAEVLEMPLSPLPDSAKRQ